MKNQIEENKQNKGFTLVELLIVIVILGILATVTVFAVTGITTRGKASACQSDFKTIQTAEEAYSANTGNYSGDTVTPLVNGQDALVAAGLMHAVSKNFTIKVFAAPVGGVETYKLTGLNNTAAGGIDCSAVFDA